MFVTPDAAGAGARRGARRDAGEGAELRHHYSGGCVPDWRRLCHSVVGETVVVLPLARAVASLRVSVQVKEKIIDQVYRNLPYSQRPKVESVALGERNTAAVQSFHCHESGVCRHLQACGGTAGSVI